MAEKGSAHYRIEANGEFPVVRLGGRWSAGAGFPDARACAAEIGGGEGTTVRVDLTAVESFDSSLPAFLVRLRGRLEADGRKMETMEGAGRAAALQKLAESARVRADAGKREPAPGWLAWMGRGAVFAWRENAAVLEFMGRGTVEFLRLLAGRSSMRAKDFFHILYTVTVQALPIVSLISILVGLIISFLGAVVLQRFAAEFAVSYLVGYGMLREMGAVMAGVIMAGRTGAGFAAEIGSMKVNEEIDALETFGIPPYGFIVLPRLLALTIALPLLTVYANVVGIFGGYLVADFMMGVPRSIFFAEMIRVIGPADFFLGVTKGFVFGALIAFAGCFRGLQCGGGAQAVGVAATRAVVLGITLIIIFNALIDYMAAMLGI